MKVRCFFAFERAMSEVEDKRIKEICFFTQVTRTLTRLKMGCGSEIRKYFWYFTQLALTLQRNSVNCNFLIRKKFYCGYST